MAFLDNLKEKANLAADLAKQASQTINEKRAEKATVEQQKKDAEQQQKQKIIDKALADAASNALTFEIVKKEDMQFVHVKLNDSSLQTEAGALYYYLGNITMDASSGPGLGAALLSGETIRRPIYSGTGEIVLEPTYGQYTIFDVDDKAWLISFGRYYASELSVQLGIKKNSVGAGLLSGHGIYQTMVSGKGRVILESDGPLEKIELNNEKLVVDGNFAIIWSASLDFKVEKATKGIWASVLSGERLVNTYSGTGTVYLCPASTKWKYITTKINKGFEHVLDKIK